MFDRRITSGCQTGVERDGDHNVPDASALMPDSARRGEDGDEPALSRLLAVKGGWHSVGNLTG
jgi:hypothetical protein